MIIHLLKAFEYAFAREGRQTVLSFSLEHMLLWHNSYLDKLQWWFCQMEYGLPKDI